MDEEKESNSGRIKKVAIVTPEFYGDTMVGGLAVSVHGLAHALRKKGIEPVVVMPAYSKYTPERFTKTPYVTEGERRNEPEIHLKRQDGIDIHKITGMALEPFTYNKNDIVADFTDEVYRQINEHTFKAFQILGANIPMVLNKAGLQDVDVVHLMEWSTASGSYWLRQSENFSDKPIVLTSHNLNYAGEVPFEAKLQTTPYNSPTFEMIKTCLRDNRGNLYGSLLELGIDYADFVNTVSPSEAEEVLGGREGVNPRVVKILQKKGLTGILNGIDSSIINPESDHRIERYLVNNYEAIVRGKKDNKIKLEEDLRKLDSYRSNGRIDPNKLLVSMLCRLTEQKSVREVLSVAEEMNTEDVQLLIVGEAENDSIRSRALKSSEEIKNVFCHPYFVGPDLQHRILAASDAILQASKWEPFGYTQVEGMAYGAVPIVTLIGGHKDTVIPFSSDGEGYGIEIKEPICNEILEGIGRFRNLFQDENARKKAVMNAVNADFTWCGKRDSVGKYIELYERAITLHPLSNITQPTTSH